MAIQFGKPMFAKTQAFGLGKAILAPNYQAVFYKLMVKFLSAQSMVIYSPLTAKPVRLFGVKKYQVKC